jgi:uncharacterized protein
MDLTLPLYPRGAFGPGLSLLLALLLGLGFGVSLERAGLGDGRKLTGQFYLRDFTVFKVMFTAIVTCALGLYWLEWVGVLERSLLFAPPTYLLPQLVGGLVFGVGFVTAGYCPGTSCVAGMSGRLDGWVALVGMVAGVIGFGEWYPVLQQFAGSTPITGVDASLPGLFRMPEGVVVGILVLLAVVGFRLIERLVRPRGFVAVLGLLGVLAIITGVARSRTAGPLPAQPAPAPAAVAPAPQPDPARVTPPTPSAQAKKRPRPTPSPAPAGTPAAAPADSASRAPAWRGCMN